MQSDTKLYRVHISENIMKILHMIIILYIIKDYYIINSETDFVQPQTFPQRRDDSMLLER